MACENSTPDAMLRFMESMKMVVRGAAEEDKEMLTELFVDTASSARTYVSIVCEAELERRNPKGDKAKFAELDHRRTILHDSMMGKINACNRACERAGAPLIYTGGKERREYGDYALRLVAELFGERV